jgi:hypothetical protein
MLFFLITVKNIFASLRDFRSLKLLLCRHTKQPSTQGLYQRLRFKAGTPSGTRTLDTLIKSQVLWPTELKEQNGRGRRT